MPKEIKQTFLDELSRRYGSLRRLERSQSLFEVGQGAARIYIRYSKTHSRNETFYGLRHEDLQQLEGYPSILCFLWDGQTEPLLIPFSEYEDVFQSTTPARDGQYKVMIFLDGGTEFYIAGVGRFNVEAYYGWSQLEKIIDSTRLAQFPEYSHSQIQTLLAAIGIVKGYDVWVPQNDRQKLDWSLADRFECRDVLPYGFEPVSDILQEVV